MNDYGRFDLLNDSKDIFAHCNVCSNETHSRSALCNSIGGLDVKRHDGAFRVLFEQRIEDS